MSALLTGTIVAALAMAAPAPQWSTEQQQVIDAIKSCWDVWVESVQQGTPDPWIDQCMVDDPSFWNSDDGAPMAGPELLHRTWGVESGVDLAWVDLRPLHVSVDGDVAVIHFYGYWRLPGPELREWARTEVWRREGGRWRQWAGHATPRERDQAP